MTIELNIFNLQRQSTIFDEIDSVNWFYMYACEDSCANDSLKNDFCDVLESLSLILPTLLLLLDVLLIP